MRSERFSFVMSMSAGFALVASSAEAAGFYIREQSAKAQGASYAGFASSARDAGYAFANPAALSRVEDIEISGSLSAIIPDTDVVTEAVGEFSIDGPQGTEFAPSAAAAFRFNDSVVFGVTVNSPYGLSTDYKSANPLVWPGATDGIESSLLTIAVTPMIAVQLTDGVALGAGFIVEYADARLTSFSGVDVATIEGDDVAFSGAIGALIDVTDDTTIGISYRGGVGHNADVTATSAAFGRFSGPATVKLNLPGVASVGVTHQATPDFAIMAEVQWQKWSDFDELAFVNKATGVNFVTEAQNYDDSFFVALGAEYAFSDALTLRAGAAYDETPTSDKFRTVRVPDASRWWLSMGLSYEIGDRFTIDAAYSAVILDDADVTLRNPPFNGTTVSYDTIAHIFSIGGSLRF